MNSISVAKNQLPASLAFCLSRLHPVIARQFMEKIVSLTKKVSEAIGLESDENLLCHIEAGLQNAESTGCLEVHFRIISPRARRQIEVPIGIMLKCNLLRIENTAKSIAIVISEYLIFALREFDAMVRHNRRRDTVQQHVKQNQIWFLTA